MDELWKSAELYALVAGCADWYAARLAGCCKSSRAYLTELERHHSVKSLSLDERRHGFSCTLLPW